MSSAYEEHVRSLRDKVFSQVSSEENWEGCREHWMQAEQVAWLREQVKKSIAWRES